MDDIYGYDEYFAAYASESDDENDEAFAEAIAQLKHNAFFDDNAEPGWVIVMPNFKPHKRYDIKPLVEPVFVPKVVRRDPGLRRHDQIVNSMKNMALAFSRKDFRSDDQMPTPLNNNVKNKALSRKYPDWDPITFDLIRAYQGDDAAVNYMKCMGLPFSGKDSHSDGKIRTPPINNEPKQRSKVTEKNKYNEPIIYNHRGNVVCTHKCGRKKKGNKNNNTRMAETQSQAKNIKPIVEQELEQNVRDRGLKPKGKKNKPVIKPKVVRNPGLKQKDPIVNAMKNALLLGKDFHLDDTMRTPLINYVEDMVLSGKDLHSDDKIRTPPINNEPKQLTTVSVDDESDRRVAEIQPRAENFFAHWLLDKEKGEKGEFYIEQLPDP